MPKKKKKASTEVKPKTRTKFEFPQEALPEYVPPPPVTGHQLLAALQSNEVNEKEFLGMKISKHIFQHLTTQEIRDLKVVFDTFDVDNSNTIDLKELRRAMKILGFRVTRREVKEMMADVDVTNRGCLNFNDFLALVIERQSDSRDIFEEIRQAFTVFDIDGDGKITLSSLKRLCREHKIRMTEREIRDMIREADHNGDDAVDEDEFIGIMLKTNIF
ncbi:uncharacterized protein LOC120334220 [Styela clava]